MSPLCAEGLRDSLSLITCFFLSAAPSVFFSSMLAEKKGKKEENPFGDDKRENRISSGRAETRDTRSL